MGREKLTFMVLIDVHKNVQIDVENVITRFSVNKPGTAKVGAISKIQTCKRGGGPFGLCETPVGCKISKQLKGGSFGDIKKFEKF